VVSELLDPCCSVAPTSACFTATPEKRIIGVLESSATKTKLFAVGPAIWAIYPSRVMVGETAIIRWPLSSTTYGALETVNGIQDGLFH
jgi:hypothetical protein